MEYAIKNQGSHRRFLKRTRNLLVQTRSLLQCADKRLQSAFSVTSLTSLCLLQKGNGLTIVNLRGSRKLNSSVSTRGFHLRQLSLSRHQGRCSAMLAPTGIILQFLFDFHSVQLTQELVLWLLSLQWLR